MNKNENETLFTPGSNCWRYEPYQRLAPLVDGEDYFRALRQACLRARSHIHILAWDFDSRLQLERDPHPDDPYPTQLRALLDYIARERGVRVHVLVWDFAAIYALERQWLATYHMQWTTHTGVHFRLDKAHPVSGSQHQKVVVIDDKIAFLGGLDLTKCRWDTSSHRPDDTRRVDPDGRQYGPFHDVQVLVDGGVAAALAELIRQRWWRSTGEHLPEDTDGGDDDPWPVGFEPLLTGGKAAIARTLPSHKDQGAVREVEHLYIDLIRRARQTLYIENQYLTSDLITQLLCERLEETSGPQIVLILPRKSGAWLEQNTMDVLRARVLRQLRAHDRHGRLRICYPHDPRLGAGFIEVHSKLLIVDDTVLRIGSSNLSNRSMRLDTECDLVVEATRPAEREAITTFRNRLLAEHLDTTVERVAGSLRETGSLLGTVDALGGRGKSLYALQDDVPKELDRLIPESTMVDLEEPISPALLMDHLVEHGERRPARNRLKLLAAGVLGLALLAGLWRFSPLSEWVNVDALVTLGRQVEQSAWAPLITLAAYVVAGLTAFPITVLIAVTVILFGTLQGAGYALAGSMLAATAGYAMGTRLGSRSLRQVAGGRLDRLSRRIARQGLVAILFVRIVPVAPFTVVNLIAGASHIRLRDFLIGTLLGMGPGILALTVVADRLLAFLRNPDWLTAAWLAAATVGIVGVLYVLRRWLRSGGQDSG